MDANQRKEIEGRIASATPFAKGLPVFRDLDALLSALDAAEARAKAAEEALRECYGCVEVESQATSLMMWWNGYFYADRSNVNDVRFEPESTRVKSMSQYCPICEANAKRIEEFEEALKEALNALLDYVDTAEKRGGFMGYGRKVMRQIAALIPESQEAEAHAKWLKAQGSGE